MPPLIDPGSQGRLDRAGALCAAIARSLHDAGWSTKAHTPSPGGRGVDLLAQRKRVRLAIEVKAIAEGRADRLIPLWSQAWLQAQRFAPRGFVPMAIVGAERVAPKAAEAVLAFIAQVAPDAAGGVADLAGLRRFAGSHLSELDVTPTTLPRRRNLQPTVRGKLFSDLNQWMLKVLLAPHLPERLLRAPRALYQGATDLAAAANVSVMSASRLLQDLRREGYLDESAPNLRLVQVRRLLERWQSAVSAQPVEERAWRALLRGEAGDAVRRWVRDAEGCFALFAAARSHRLGLVDGVPSYVYVRQISSAPKGFVAAAPGEAPDVIVRRARTPESVFRGVVVASERPTCDVLQVWLDVASHPSRGNEQAALIWRKVLAPLCATEGT